MTYIQDVIKEKRDRKEEAEMSNLRKKCDRCVIGALKEKEGDTPIDMHTELLEEDVHKVLSYSFCPFCGVELPILEFKKKIVVTYLPTVKE